MSTRAWRRAGTTNGVAPAVAPPRQQAAGRRRPAGARRLLPLALATALAAVGVAAAVAARASGDGVRTVELTVRHSRFLPAVVEAERGETVRFVVVNTDPIDHELIVGDEAVHQRHRVGRERHHHGDVPGEVSVAAGTTAETSFRFDRAGRVAFICHLPGHEAYGMVGVVEVGG